MSPTQITLAAFLTASLGLIAACQDESEDPAPHGTGGGEGLGGDGGSGDGGDGDGDLTGPRCGVSEEPGTRLTAPSDEGAGPCAGVSAGDFAAQVRDENPDLSDVTEMQNPEGENETGLHYIAFEEDDGRLQAVFYQGSGDCPSGCIDDVYHYFEADDDCEPVLVGAYSNVQNYDDECREITGEPMWGHPVASPTTHSCEERATPVIDGTFEIPFSGTRERCSAAGLDELEDISGTLEMTISPSPDDARQAVLSLSDSSLDDTGLESNDFSATIEYLQYRVETQWDNTPTTCLESYNLSLSLDLEICFEGQLSYEETVDLDCNDNPCKGSVQLTLDLSTLRDDVGR